MEDIISRSNSSSTSRRINDSHSSNNSNDQIRLDNYQPFNQNNNQNWNHQDQIYQKDSRKFYFFFI